MADQCATLRAELELRNETIGKLHIQLNNVRATYKMITNDWLYYETLFTQQVNDGVRYNYGAFPRADCRRNYLPLNLHGAESRSD